MFGDGLLRETCPQRAGFGAVGGKRLQRVYTELGRRRESKPEIGRNTERALSWSWRVRPCRGRWMVTSDGKDFGTLQSGWGSFQHLCPRSGLTPLWSLVIHWDLGESSGGSSSVSLLTFCFLFGDGPSLSLWERCRFRHRLFCKSKRVYVPVLCQGHQTRGSLGSSPALSAQVQNFLLVALFPFASILFSLQSWILSCWNDILFSSLSSSRWTHRVCGCCVPHRWPGLSTSLAPALRKLSIEASSV